MTTEEFEGLTIKVETNDIVSGRRCDMLYCPVSKAAQRVINNCSNWKNHRVIVCADPYTMSYQLAVRVAGNMWAKAYLPIDVSDKIAEYDNSGKMEPFEFTCPRKFVGTQLIMV